MAFDVIIPIYVIVTHIKLVLCCSLARRVTGAR
jgi:hypothetical protein